MSMYRAGSISCLTTRCEDGQLWQSAPLDDDPYREKKIGTCPECDGNGCITCPRCEQTVGDADAAEGCEDHDCPLIGGCK